MAGKAYLKKTELVNTEDNPTPSKILTMDENNVITESSPEDVANVVGDNFVKLDPSPATEQTIQGNLTLTGDIESFAGRFASNIQVGDEGVTTTGGVNTSQNIISGDQVKITSLVPLADEDATRKDWVEDKLALKVNLSGGNSITGNQGINGNIILTSGNIVQFSSNTGIMYDGTFLRIYNPSTTANLILINASTGKVAFASNIIIPSPTAGNEGVNRDYLDAALGDYVKKTGETTQQIDGSIGVGQPANAIYSISAGESKFTGQVHGLAPVDGDAFVTKDYLESIAIINTTSTPFTLSTINSTYPSAKNGDRIICPNVNTGTIYTKANSAWIVTAGVLLT